VTPLQEAWEEFARSIPMRVEKPRHCPDCGELLHARDAVWMEEERVQMREAFTRVCANYALTIVYENAKTKVDHESLGSGPEHVPDPTDPYTPPDCDKADADRVRRHGR